MKESSTSSNVGMPKKKYQQRIPNHWNVVGLRIRNVSQGLFFSHPPVDFVVFSAYLPSIGQYIDWQRTNSLASTTATPLLHFSRPKIEIPLFFIKTLSPPSGFSLILNSINVNILSIKIMLKLLKANGERPSTETQTLITIIVVSDSEETIDMKPNKEIFISKP